MRHNLEANFDGSIDFLNPTTTDAWDAQLQVEDVRHILGVREDSSRIAVIYEPAMPEHIRQHVPGSGKTSIYSSAGDGTVRRVFTAMIGHVENDPEATHKNFPLHRELVSNVVYMAGAGGNARNYALSTLGRASDNPERLRELRDAHRLDIAYHRPLIYMLEEKHGKILRTGVITSSFGVGLPAQVAQSLEDDKQEACNLRPSKRLRHELGIMSREMMSAKPFSANLVVDNGTDVASEILPDITGIAVIRSRIYAKQGRTPRSVNVDTNLAQVVVSRHHRALPIRAVASFGVAAALRTGLHERKPLDFSGVDFVITNTGSNPVPFEADGEVSVQNVIEPGQMLSLCLARIAVPILVAR